MVEVLRWRRLDGSARGGSGVEEGGPLFAGVVGEEGGAVGGWDGGELVHDVGGDEDGGLHAQGNVDGVAGAAVHFLKAVAGSGDVEGAVEDALVEAAYGDGLELQGAKGEDAGDEVEGNGAPQLLALEVHDDGFPFDRSDPDRQHALPVFFAEDDCAVSFEAEEEGFADVDGGLCKIDLGQGFFVGLFDENVVNGYFDHGFLRRCLWHENFVF